MRIIAGEFRGRAVAAPAGQGTRPTTDRVRESLFASLYSARGGFEGARVLDAFAGSGALGLEAVSRGAAHATFCETDRKAADCLQKNLQMAGPDRTRLARIDVLRRTPPAAAPFDLVFLDPPYATPAAQVAGLLARLQEAGLLAPGALVAYEHDGAACPGADPAFAALPLTLHVQKTYGKTAIDIYRKGE